MKKLIIILFLTGLWSCTQQDYIVQSDQAPDIDFEQYETYNFSTHARSSDVRYLLSDLELKHNIRDAIEHELSAKGYEQNAANPDLLVNFRIFEEPTEITGYEESAGYWGNNEVRNIEDRTTYELEKGSLIVDIIDAESGEVVWKGYASGIIEENQFDRSEESIATAVDMIFDQYGFRANEP